jgi:hypothetical protein
VTVAFALTLTALGFIGAFVSGLVGVGGAMVMIPLIYYIPPLISVGSLDIKHVAGVTMAQVLAASLLGAWTHSRRARVHTQIAGIGGAAMGTGALLGALGSEFASSRVLLAVFGAMTTVALPLMFVPPSPEIGVADDRPRPRRRVAVVTVPGAIGIASGLVGAGGAFLLVPVLIAVFRLPVRPSIGTSLAMTAISASLGFVGKALTGQIPLWPTLAVMLGALPGAPLGARLSYRAPVATLRAVLAALITLVTIRVWADVLSR